MKSPHSSFKDSKNAFSFILGTGLIIFYVVFTLLPNSHSLMVKWPWVLWWQIGLALGPIVFIIQTWKTKTIGLLGNKLDWLTVGWLICLGINVARAQFTNQAGWYAWAIVCTISILYTLTNWITDPSKVSRLIHFQGVVVISFSILSLCLWTTQTALPYLEVLKKLRSHGIIRNFDWQIISLRNWYPIGHQNYVAGFLLLSLPLLVSLGILSKGKRRVFWCGGFIISLCCLYTTASRGSWFGLIASIGTFLTLSFWYYPKTRKSISIASFFCTSGILLWGISSDRLRGLLSIFLHQDNKEIAYRAATNVTGWLMGLDHSFFGAGLGSITLLYQKYRPYWADSSATLTYQLHSTPAQLWAELGLAGVSLLLLSFCWLIHLGAQRFSKTAYSHESFLVIASLWSGLIGYSIFSLTDYQLDNVCISGTLVIFFSILIFDFKKMLPQMNKEISVQRLALVTISVCTAITVTSWLYPIHRAWMLSSQGFSSLENKNVSEFVNSLEQAHSLVPWEPYYPYQLGWNLGELAYHTENIQQKISLQEQGSQWLKVAIEASPYREFGYSNLGWLLVNSHPKESTTYFIRAAQLTSNKKGIFFALGYSLLQGNRLELSIQAMALELLRNPALITSPIWQVDELNNIHEKVIAKLEAACAQFIKQAPNAMLSDYFRQVRGALQWWKGDFEAAKEDFEQGHNKLRSLMLDLAQDKLPLEALETELSPSSTAITAWLSQENREDKFYRALLLSESPEALQQKSYISRLNDDITNSAQKAKSFHQWLTKSAPQKQHRNKRLGFGVLSRHIDGPIPSDFSPQLENVLMVKFFNELFENTVYNPDLDKQLEPLKRQLINQLSDV